MCDKLVVLMWKDWSPEVRDVAAEALGKLGKGKVRRRHQGSRGLVHTVPVTLMPFSVGSHCIQ